MDLLVKALKALADPIRLQIVEFLRRPVVSCCSKADGVCACDLDNYLGLAQPTISHHMKLLVDSGLVRAEKRGRWVYYELNHETFGQVVDSLLKYRTTPPRSAETTRRHERGL